MNNSKVIKIISKLSNKELGDFSAYLASPYFNKNTILFNIVEVILSFKTNFDDPKLTHDYVMKSVYSKENRKIDRLRNDMTLIFKHLKQFMAFEEIRASDIQTDLALLSALQNKEMNTLFEKESDHIKSTLSESKEPQKDLYQFQFYDELDKFFLSKRTRVYDENLQLKMDALDSYYLTVKLREACEMLNRNAIYQKQYQLGLSKFLDDFLANEPLDLYNSTIRIYYATYKMLKSNERSDFEYLLNLLETDTEDIPAEQVRELYIHAQNFCTRNINKGNKEYFNDMFNIFQKLISNNLLMVDGFIPHTTYKNVVTVALNIEENEWVQNFIESHKANLKEDVRESAYSYNLAKYNYEVGLIDEAVQLLQSVHYEDDYYQIDARYLLLKIFYETDEHESLLYYIDAFKLYLKRNKDFNIDTRELIITFLKLLRKTAILKHRKPYLNKSDFQLRYKKLENQFIDNQNIPYRKWMETILQDLNK
ncbi:MAG: hypothetical protein R2753_16465 [Chitinophagales bacterium]